MEYDVIETQHADLLKDLAIVCRSDKSHFLIDDRIQVIREKLSNTEYEEYLGYSSQDDEENAPYSMWSKKPITELPEDIILISTHCDVVPNIQNCFSELEEGGFYRGTYDNLGTNAAALILMTEHEIPDNVVFVFTGDEETGRCNGAKFAAKYLSKKGKNPLCLALDVTYEGFHDNRLWSLENCALPKKNEPNNMQAFLNNISQAALDTESKQSFCYIRASRNFTPTNMHEKYIEKSIGMYDEAYAYQDAGFPSMSVCLPCYGNMHGESGVKIKQPVFEGYVLSLASFVYSLTRTHSQLIEAYKIAKDTLIEKAASIIFEKPQYQYLFHNYDEDYDEDEEYEEDDEFDAYEDEWEEDLYYTDVELAYSAFAPIMSDLYAEAAMYDITQEDEFIENVEIPFEYIRNVVSNPDGAILPEEEERIHDFLREVFQNVHNEEEYTETYLQEYNDEQFYDYFT